jgi:hypothetical protein
MLIIFQGHSQFLSRHAMIEEREQELRFPQDHFIVRHTGQTSAASADPVSSTYAKTQSVLFFVFKEYVAKRLRLLTVALDPGSALTCVRLAVMTTKN